MVVVARAIHCELQQPKMNAPRVMETSVGGSDQVRIVLQPRLCTLRSFASDRGGVFRTKESGGGADGDDMEVTSFMENLYEYIESTKKSHDFEIITGRLAMIVFAATVCVESTTGNSVFKKMDMTGIEEALGACLAAITCAAAFAYSYSARKKVGKIFTISCNAFIDALIDNIVDSLFYESDDEDLGSDFNDKL